MFPHEFFFIVFNAVYILPVIYAFLFGFSVGGADTLFKITPEIIEQMLFFYFVMMVSFFIGSRLFGFGIKLKKDDGVFAKIKYDSPVFSTLCVIVIFLHVIFKILLVREGVYDAYAFDSGAMNSKIWTVSMGLTELVMALFVLFLFSGNQHKALICFFAMSLNLLHGSRIFTLISVFIYVFYYLYYLRAVRGCRVVLYGCILSVITVLFFFAVFLYRSDVAFDISNIDFDHLISPVMYEALFNQVSFLIMLQKMNAQLVSFSPHMLVFDAIRFTIPNIFSARDGLYSTSFGELSPLGGLSGYASAIIYFSYYYCVWYFILGSFLSILLRATRTGKHKLITRFIYVYFVCDTLFRLHRDPFFIALKMLVDNVLFILVGLLITIALKKYLRRICVS